MKKTFDKEMLFRALADRTRLRLLNLLGDNEVCVCFLVEVLGVSQPKVSRHLAYLKRAGIMKSRRDGKWMHYRVVAPSDPFAAGLLQDVRAWLSQDKVMQTERKRLVNFCCSPNIQSLFEGLRSHACRRPIAWARRKHILEWKIR